MAKALRWPVEVFAPGGCWRVMIDMMKRFFELGVALEEPESLDGKVTQGSSTVLCAMRIEQSTCCHFPQVSLARSHPSLVLFHLSAIENSL